MEAKLVKRISRYAFSGFYLVAGIMHFIVPEVYHQVMPEWLGNIELLNYVAGIVEIAVAIGIFIPLTRKLASKITIAMLLAFTISHIYFIQLGSCAGDLCIPAWIGWFRLVVIHPLLIYWAYKVGRNG